MSEVAESVRVKASLAEAWEYFFDSGRWPTWVDGLGSVVSADGYPRQGGTLRWRSGPAGRGDVVETVLEHRPRRIHRVEFTDSQTYGELDTSFEVEGEGVRIGQTLRYRLRSGSPLSAITDFLFIRSQQRGALQRSLLRLRHELEEAAHLAE